MDPKHNQESASLELPKPVDVALPEVPAEQAHTSEKAATKATEQGRSTASAPQPQSPPPQLAMPPTSATSSAALTPQIADDIDLIEKEWVDKAKEIVAATRQDPYQQNKELNRFRADYIQKRYNKVIKLNDE